MQAERRVLHVLPHPGGGGETAVDVLSAIPGFPGERVYLSPGSEPGPALARGVVATLRRRGYDLLHVHGEVAAALCLPLLAARPSVFTPHGLHLVRRLGGVAQRAAALNLRLAVRAASRTICVSEHEQRELARFADARRSVVIPNGVRLPTPSPRPARDPVAIWVGSLDERKDPLTAARAAEDADVELLVVGDGPLRAGLGRARLLGRRSDVADLLGGADLYLHTSRREGLSFSLLEAMAAGLACVAGDLPENREALGDAGLYAPLGDVEAFAAALRTLADDPEKRGALGTAARARIQRFTVQNMVARTRLVYEEILGRRGVPLELPPREQAIP
jgi:glycosyltransferase involved in cell wall biosynthesis